MMRRALPYLLLFIYATVIVKPLLPYLKDMAAHVLFFKDHMRTVHAHNGKFHVHSEVAKDTREEAPEKNTGSKKDTAGNDQLLPGIQLFSTRDISRVVFKSITASLLHAHIQHDFPPPKFA